RIHALRPHPGQMRSAKAIRGYLEGSEIAESHKNCGRVQDPYSLRCMPQVHGASHDVLAWVRGVLEREINSVTDNPLVFVEDGEVLSGGNFHGQPLAIALDCASIAIAELASISERRIELLLNPAWNANLPAFLSVRPGLESGLMMAQVTAAALVSENKTLAHPASVDSIPTSAGKEDHVSMGLWAARKCAQIVERTRKVLAIEAVVAAQALDFRHPLRPGRGVELAHRALREHIQFFSEDRPLAPAIARAEEMIARGELLSAAQKGRRDHEPNCPNF
ncbi:MAG: aromatic amino acid lyase, partial [Deltaproteobacteria bacterium]|nr:aromatic amino acid lyase [Deltaproteobacteria bacterium]